MMLHPFALVPLAQILAFPLIVLVKALIFWFTLRGGVLKAIGHSILVNFVSTSVGIGLLIGLPTAVEPLFATLFEIGWTLQRSVIFLVFAVMLFGISWLIEAAALIRLRPTVPPRRVVFACCVANALTYVGLLLFVISKA